MITATNIPFIHRTNKYIDTSSPDNFSHYPYRLYNRQNVFVTSTKPKWVFNIDSVLPQLSQLYYSLERQDGTLQSVYRTLDYFKVLDNTNEDNAGKQTAYN